LKLEMCGLSVSCNVARYSQNIVVFRVHKLAVSGEVEGIETAADGGEAPLRCAFSAS
jgi:hypothetical protein